MQCEMIPPAQKTNLFSPIPCSLQPITFTAANSENNSNFNPPTAEQLALPPLTQSLAKYSALLVVHMMIVPL